MTSSPSQVLRGHRLRRRLAKGAFGNVLPGSQVPGSLLGWSLTRAPTYHTAGPQASKALIGEPFIPGQRLPGSQAGPERRPNPEFNSICTCSWPGAAPQGETHSPIQRTGTRFICPEPKGDKKAGSQLGSSTGLGPKVGSRLAHSPTSGSEHSLCTKDTPTPFLPGRRQ